jgi:hypothetical protein
MMITSVVLVVALGLFLTEGIRGNTGLTYAVLLLVAELTHLAALAVFNRRGFPGASRRSGRRRDAAA